MQVINFEVLADSTSSVAKAALRTLANSALMRACGVAFRLAAMQAKHIGRGIDGLNDLKSAELKAQADAVFLNSTGKDGDTLEDQLRKLMALYLGASASEKLEGFFAPMSVEEAIEFMSTQQDVSVGSDDELIAALEKISGETRDQLLARKEAENAKQAGRNAKLAPLAHTLLESCADNGQDLEGQFAELNLNTQFGILAKMVDSSANQYDRDLSRAMKFSSSKSTVLRSLTVSDVAVGKADLNELEQMLLRFVNEHQSELEI